MSDQKPPQHAVEAVPDPDEDDLDELDDVLDDFAATKLESQPTPSASGPGRPPSSTTTAATGPSLPAPPTSFDDDFAHQLQAGMADLLGELDTNPDMQKQLEAMMAELGAVAAAEHESTGAAAAAAAAAAGSAAEGSRAAADATADKPSASAAPKADASFQDTIRRTMERMQTSGAAAGAAAAAGPSEDELLAQMLREMEQGGAGGGEEDFSKMLMGMMEQLTNKDILYEPMKELHDKFPAWLAQNGDNVGKDDLARYEEQRRLVAEIVAKFEEKGYSDDSAQCREYIVERMQKMQAAGSPPPDLVGDMNAAQEAMGEIDAGCPQQ